MNAFSVRLIIFLLIAAFMVVGPVYRQIFDGSSKIFRSWTMFSGIGRGVVDARFTLVLDNGSEVEIDYLSFLAPDAESYRDMPRNTWRIRESAGGAIEVAERLCEHMKEDAVLKIYSRVATKRGWDIEFSGDEFACKDLLDKNG